MVKIAKKVKTMKINHGIHLKKEILMFNSQNA